MPQPPMSTSKRILLSVVCVVLLTTDVKTCKKYDCPFVWHTGRRVAYLFVKLCGEVGLVDKAVSSIGRSFASGKRR